MVVKTLLWRNFYLKSSVCKFANFSLAIFCKNSVKLTYSLKSYLYCKSIWRSDFHTEWISGFSTLWRKLLMYIHVWHIVIWWLYTIWGVNLRNFHTVLWNDFSILNWFDEKWFMDGSEFLACLRYYHTWARRGGAPTTAKILAYPAP